MEPVTGRGTPHWGQLVTRATCVAYKVYACQATIATTMPVVNNYTPPSVTDIPKDYYGPDPFDVNFCFPAQEYFEQLESDRVKLVPFEPRLHARAFTEQLAEAPETMQWLSTTPTTLEQFLPFFERTFRRDPTFCTFAVIDKLKPNPSYPELGGGLAGMLSLMAASPGALSLEIGWVVFNFGCSGGRWANQRIAGCDSPSIPEVLRDDARSLTSAKAFT